MRLMTFGAAFLSLGAVASALIGGASGFLEKSVRADPRVFRIARPIYWAAETRYHVLFQDSGRITDYLEGHRQRKLQLGAGDINARDWLNSDFEPTRDQIFLDVTERFPFPDGSLHAVFSEHLIEHVPYESGVAMLKECYRVMAPGAKIRTVTPNLLQFLHLVRDGAEETADREFIESKLRFHDWPTTASPATYILNKQVREWGHQFLYDPATLRKSLELAGFKNIVQYKPGAFGDPVFREVEARANIPGSDLQVVNGWEAMAFEAER